MTPKERAAMQQALEALEYLNDYDEKPLLLPEAITALREALDHSGEANEMVEFFSKEMKNKISVARAEQTEQEPECKYKEAYIIWQDKTEWVQETAQPKELGMHRADVLRQRIENLQNAAPVRTKDMTDDEIAALWASDGFYRTPTDFARAVIAKDREKNKCQH